MSQISAHAGAHADEHHHHHDPAHHPAMGQHNITLAPGAGRGLSAALIFAGLIGIGLTIVGAMGLENGVKHATASYLVGTMAVTAISIGALFMVMIFHLTMAGWSVTIRRQFENIASLLPICVVLITPVFLVELWTGGQLYKWMNEAKTAGDVLAVQKAPFLNETFFMVRLVFYFLVWTYLARRMWYFSREQDLTGDKWLSNKARFTSSWGILIFALTVAFAGFDWLMSLDFHFYSTMWGVYIFAGAAYSCVALVAVILAVLLGRGKLQGAVTSEHLHDLGKLMFAFTVFWAYIAYSQYFLIWYANIPEATAYMLARKQGGWEHIGIILVIGHFLLPFFILLWFNVKRSRGILLLVGVWMLAMHVIDLFWVIRPFVYAVKPGGEGVDEVGWSKLWLDGAAILGVLCLYAGLLIRKIASGPLVPLKDPRLPEALGHKNYV